MPERPNLTVLRRFLPALGLGIGAAGIVFVVRTLIVRGDEVADAFGSMDTGNLALSIALGVAAMWWIGRNWVAMLAARGHHAPPRRAMNWYFTGQLGKYVPGGIWPIVGRAELAVRGGVARPAAYGATTASMAATYGAATLVTAVGSLASWSYPLVGITLAALLGAGAGVIAMPPVQRVTVRLAARAGVSNLTFPTVGDVAASVTAHVPSWLLVAASTWVTARAFGVDFSPAEMAFASSASWLAGFVVVGVPGGIGVREAVFTALATPAAGSSVAVAIALASRVVFVTVDIVGTVLAAVVSGRSASRRGRD